MVKMIRKEIEIKEVETKIVTGIQCDECNCEIYPSEDYFEVFTGHRRWGHDSVDSHEYLDICSLKCLTENMNKYYQNSSASDTYFYEIEMETYNVKK